MTEGGVPRRVDVPVEMPEGMSYEGVFGREMDRDMAVKVAASPMPVMGGFIGGSGGNRPSGMPMSRQAAGPQQVAPPRPRPMKDELKANLAARLDPIIQALIQRVKSGGRPSVDEARFVFGDRAYVRITLNGASPAALEVLRNAGLVITKSEGNVVVGHVAVAQLEPLSTLPIVSFIAPR